MAGTGAALLLAAAALFVAVRWEQIPEAAKLGAVAALTGAFLLAGRRLREPLPATAGALFHLGALLVPVDVAALAIRAELGWGALLLVEGVTCAAGFALAARAEASVVLRWATAASVVVAAAGLGATTPLPAGPLVALCTAAALLLAAPRAAAAWAVVAGLAPVAGLVLDASRLAAGVVADLGLAGDRPGTALVTGLVAGAVLLVLAHRRSDAGLALLATGSLAAGLAVARAGVTAGDWLTPGGLAAALLVVEVAALLAARDRFWSRPTGALASLGEALAVPASLAAGGVVLLSPLVVTHEPRAAATVGLLAATWGAADLRRRVPDGRAPGVALLLGGRFPTATLGLALTVPATVLLATGSAPATSVALLATAALLVGGGRPLAAGTAAFLATWAPLAALGSPEWELVGSTPPRSAAQLVVAVVAGAAGSALLAAALRWRSAAGLDDRRSTWALAAVSLAPLALGAAIAGSHVPAHLDVVVAVVATGLAWALVAMAGAAGGDAGPATAARLTGVLGVAWACAPLPAAGAALLATLLGALVVFDAVRLTRPELAWGVVAALPLAVAAGATAAGLAAPEVGVALAAAALVAAGLGSLAPAPWRPAAGGAALASGALAVTTAWGDAAATGAVSVLLGIGALVAGLALDRGWLLTAGAAAATTGAWVWLDQAGVATSEPYVAPVAVSLLLLGHRAREAASSWLTAVPAVALLGGAALVERVGGGGGGHALVAGAVGVAAVAAGGTWRLAGPLVTGTALLGAVAVHESLGVTAGVPTWGWLALGGTALLATGVALERADAGPVETGRRLVDAVATRYR